MTSYPECGFHPARDAIRRDATIAQYRKIKRSTVNDGEVKYANNRTYRRSIDVSTSV